MIFNSTKNKVKIISAGIFLFLLFLYSIGYLLTPKVNIYDNKRYDFYQYAKNTFGAPTYLYGTVNYAKGEFKNVEHLNYDVAVIHKPISVSEASKIEAYISKGGNAIFIMSQELVESEGFRRLFSVSSIIEDLKLPPKSDYFIIQNVDWRYTKREVPWKKDFKVVQYTLGRQSTLLKEAQFDFDNNPIVITSNYGRGRFCVITFDLGSTEKWKYSGNFLARTIYLTTGSSLLYYIHPLYNVEVYLFIVTVISSVLLIESFRKSPFKNINFSLFLCRYREEMVAFGLIILLASIIRLWDITSLLPIPDLDELWCVFNTEVMFKGKGFVFGSQTGVIDRQEFARQLLIPTPFFVITLIPIKLGEIISGDYYLGLRLSRAILSIISIILIYFFTRYLFNKRTAAISILIMALSQWHYVTSGVKNIFIGGYIITFLITCLWLFWLGVKKDSKYFIPFGIVLGIVPEANITYILPLVLIFFVIMDKDARKSLLKPNLWISVLIITVFIFPNLLVKYEYRFDTYKYFYSKMAEEPTGYQGIENPNSGNLLKTIHYKIWKITTFFLRGVKVILKKFFIGEQYETAIFNIGNKSIFGLAEYIFVIPSLLLTFFKSLKGNAPERFIAVWFIAAVLPITFLSSLAMQTYVFILCLPALDIMIAHFIDFCYDKLKVWNIEYSRVFTYALIPIFIVSGYQLSTNYVRRYSELNNYLESRFHVKFVSDDNQKEVITQAVKMGKFLEKFQEKEPDVHIVVQNWDLEKMVLSGTNHTYLSNLWMGNRRFAVNASLSVLDRDRNCKDCSYPNDNPDEVEMLKCWEKGKKNILYIFETDFATKMLYPSSPRCLPPHKGKITYEKVRYLHPNMKLIKVFRYLNGEPLYEIRQLPRTKVRGLQFQEIQQ